MTARTERFRTAWRDGTLLNAFPVAVLLPLFLLGLTNDRPQSFSILDPAAPVWLESAARWCAALFVVYFPIVAYLRRQQSNAFNQIGTLAYCISLAPLSLGFLTHQMQWQIFTPSCGAPTVSDYHWFILDNLAKGALADIMESFHLNIYRCPPDPESIVASISTFLVRLFSTAVVLYTMAKVYRRWRRKIIRVQQDALYDPVNRDREPNLG